MFAAIYYGCSHRLLRKKADQPPRAPLQILDSGVLKSLGEASVVGQSETGGRNREAKQQMGN